jgi:hypothetical protein
MKKITVLLIVGALCLQSCATIFSGRYKQIKFDSEPQGATVSINGVDMGKTPCNVSVKKKLSTQNVEIRLAGYKSREFDLEKSASNMVWLDAAGLICFIIPGLVFICVDLATGAIVDFDRPTYNIELEKK